MSVNDPHFPKSQWLQYHCTLPSVHYLRHDYFRNDICLKFNLFNFDIQMVDLSTMFSCMACTDLWTFRAAVQSLNSFYLSLVGY
jgi:hypothetical protein